VLGAEHGGYGGKSYGYFIKPLEYGRNIAFDAQKIEFLQKLLTKWERNKLIEPSSSRYG
jgi:hypothetical protein